MFAPIDARAHEPQDSTALSESVGEGATLRTLASTVLSGDELQRRAARGRLARESAVPEVLAWFWVATLECDDGEFTDLTALLPQGLRLLPSAVPPLADVLASAARPERAAAHAELVSKLCSAHRENLDVATLVATSPVAHIQVLIAALDLLANAGHPTSSALVRAAAHEVRQDPGHLLYAEIVIGSVASCINADEIAIPRVAPPEPSSTRSVPHGGAAVGTARAARRPRR